MIFSLFIDFCISASFKINNFSISIFFLKYNLKFFIIYNHFILQYVNYYDAYYILFIFIINYNKFLRRFFSVWYVIEERAIEVAEFIIKSNATVRETAKKFGISKSTVHTDVMNKNVFLNYN